MNVTLWGLKTCDTCRKALMALPGAEFRDIRATPLTGAEITALVARFGPALVNRASTTWRGLSEAERELPAPALIAAHPAVMKRPVIRAGDDWHLGWTPAVRGALGVA